MQFKALDPQATQTGVVAAYNPYPRAQLLHLPASKLAQYYTPITVLAALQKYPFAATLHIVVVVVHFAHPVAQAVHTVAVPSVTAVVPLAAVGMKPTLHALHVAAEEPAVLQFVTVSRVQAPVALKKAHSFY